MKPLYICLAGSPSCGKTTAKEIIAQNFPHVIVYKEPAQILIDSKNLKGGVQIKKRLQIKIAQIYIQRLQEILADKDSGAIHLDESGPFNQVYSNQYLPPDKQQFYAGRQNELLNQITTGYIYVDTPPELCWERRKLFYEKQIESFLKSKNIEGKRFDRKKLEFLQKNHDRIFLFDPLLENYFTDLTSPKLCIENNYQDLERFKREVLSTFEKLLTLLKR